LENLLSSVKSGMNNSEIHKVIPSAAIVSIFPEGNAVTCEAGAAIRHYYFRSQERAKGAAAQQALGNAALQ
jgi:hypothetical protein